MDRSVLLLETSSSKHTHVYHQVILFSHPGDTRPSRFAVRCRRRAATDRSTTWCLIRSSLLQRCRCILQIEGWGLACSCRWSEGYKYVLPTNCLIECLGGNRPFASALDVSFLILTPATNSSLLFILLDFSLHRSLLKALGECRERVYHKYINT